MNIQYSDRSQRLFNRVREDASVLRHDLRDLVSQTVRSELPTQAHSLMDRGRRRFDQSAVVASRQLKLLGQSMREHKGGVLTGVALLATAGAAAWLLRGMAQNSNSKPIQLVDGTRGNDADFGL